MPLNVDFPKYIDEIGVLLADQYFDILALKDVGVRDYDLIRADRSRTGRGVCLYSGNI